MARWYAAPYPRSWVAAPRQLLFVCTGNICRSPLAQVYAAHRLAARGRADVSVASASTLGITGSPAHPLSIAIAGDEGLDLRPHRSQPLTGFLLRASDLVLAMTEEHREECRRRFPSGVDRVKLLGSFRAGGRDRAPEGEIGDPLGSDLDCFREVWGQIKEGVDGLLARYFA